MNFLCYAVLSLYLLQSFSVSSKGVTVEKKTPTFTLTDGVKIPVVGLGTWQAHESELEKAIEAALEAGYRHIDTAHSYENEKVIGKVLRRWFDSGKLKRNDIFLVTKLPPSGNRASAVEKFMNRSLEYLQVDYVDLYLVHTPFAYKDIEGNLHPFTPEGKIDLDTTTDHVSLWKAMEKQVDAGRTKAIGLSNFNKTQIQRILDISRIRPVNLQIELHAYNQQNELVDWLKKEKIVVTAYSPIGAPGLGKLIKNIKLPDLLGNPTVTAIAKKHNKSPAQVLLRFTNQRGIVVIPKSTNPERLKQNLNIFDFTLDEEDLKAMRALNRDLRTLNFAQAFPGIETHPEYPYHTNT